MNRNVWNIYAMAMKLINYSGMRGITPNVMAKQTGIDFVKLVTVDGWSNLTLGDIVKIAEILEVNFKIELTSMDLDD